MSTFGVRPTRLRESRERGRPPAGRPRGTAEQPAPPAPERFRRADRYRAEREWQRYEGTAQRALWRELRERFLDRHSEASPWAVDLGAGPGRFTARVGTGETRRVALDVSAEMLRLLSEKYPAVASGRPLPDRVIGDAGRAPLAPSKFGTVALLGNALGFAGAGADRLWEAALSLVAPGGLLLIEVAPGAGERSRYLSRLPPSAVARLLRSPLGAVRPRVEREGFAPLAARRAEEGEFRRFSALEIAARLAARHWRVAETMAVAPALGADGPRLEAVRGDPKAWAHLVQLEEESGREAGRWPRAAAVLVAARRPALDAHN